MGQVGQREECLSKLILFESSLKRALQQYELHYHEERNDQGKENKVLFPRQTQPVGSDQGLVQCQERLGGLLKYYDRVKPTREMNSDWLAPP